MTLTGLFIGWEIQIVASILVVFVASGLAIAIRRGRRFLAETINPVVLDLLGSIGLVGVLVATVIAIAGIWEQTDVLLDQLDFLRVDGRGPEVILTAVIIVAIQVLSGISTRLLRDLTDNSKALTEHQREISLRLTKLLLWTVGLIVIFGVWDVDLTGLLVGAGFLGIVFGLAAQKTIGSLIAGFVLMFSRPFEVSDWVVIGDHEGFVSDITMMSTRIQAFNGEYIVVPNDVVSSETVVNRTRQGRIRVDVEVGVDYDVDVDEAKAVALDRANELHEEVSEVLEHPEPSVRVNRFGDSSIALTVRVWVDQPTPTAVGGTRDALVRSIKDGFEEADIKIPFPQRELTGRAETSGFRIAGEQADTTVGGDQSTTGSPDRSAD